MLTEAHVQFYQGNGYVVVPAVFSPQETASYRDHFMELRRQPRPGDDTGIDIGGDDPIKRYPRMIKPHRWDVASLQWMLDPRLNVCLTGLLGREPYAVQTMVYFKPPGSRGQALHQDNYYLRVQPGTCMAAWMALDACDEANGCLQVVPGSHTWPILCTEVADTQVSFTDVTVPLPPGYVPRPVLMDAGDVLFFNGSIVHGSFPNTTTDRFRRALIGHYIEGDSAAVSKGYQPAYRMDGTPLELEGSLGSDTCGVWVERGASQAIEVSGRQTATHRQHGVPVAH
jgi:ectoine hydroxylase-related dioxygenase (phytanoyl-CoA dioxygenase family)